jgi:hypothetical protein
MRLIHPILLAILVTLGASACTDTENPDEVNEGEVITTVVLTFAPQGGGDPLEFRWADPESDGDPLIDDIVLPDSDDFDLAISFLNELEEPPEDIGAEVAQESDEHQVFITGTAVEGPAMVPNAAAVVVHAYSDTDVNGFPVGLDSEITTLGPGSGTFVVTLRHLPPEGDVAIKTGTLASEVVEGGFDGIPGDTDAQVTFDLAVQ